MHTPVDTAVEPVQTARDQLAGSPAPAPEPDEPCPLVDPQELWDRLGDFA
jgi:hypothetical protein